MEAYKRRGSLWLEGFSDSHHCWTDSVSSSCLLLTPWVILSKPTAPKQYPPPTPHTLCTQRYKHASYFTHARVQNLHPFKQAFCLIPTNCSKFPSLWALPWSPSWHQKVTKIQRCHKQVLFKRQHTRTLSKWFSHLLFFDHAQFHCSKTCKECESCLCEDTYSQVFRPSCN